MKRDEKAPNSLTLEIKAGGELWGVVHALPKEFKTGSRGFSATGKITNPGNPEARYQMSVNVTLIGSKPDAGE